jgi:hypothetical protein
VPLPKSQQLQYWVWASMRTGNRTIARQHAWSAVKASPSSFAAWKTFLAIRLGKAPSVDKNLQQIARGFAPWVAVEDRAATTHQLHGK